MGAKNVRSFFVIFDAKKTNNKNQKEMDKVVKILSERIDVNENYIRDICLKFLHRVPHGKLSKYEFIELYCHFRSEPSHKLYAISEYIFNSFDKDKNGFIDLEEFIVKLDNFYIK